MNVPDVTNGGYIDALASQQYLTRTEALRIRRWRINNNMPGVPAFCPLIRRIDAMQEALQFDLAGALRELDQTFGPDILMRDQAIPNGVILPISATITSLLDFRARYDRNLEVFSGPFMERYARSYRFGKLTTSEDGPKATLFSMTMPTHSLPGAIPI